MLCPVSVGEIQGCTQSHDHDHTVYWSQGYFLWIRPWGSVASAFHAARLQNREPNELWGLLFLPCQALNFGAGSEERSELQFAAAVQTVSFEQTQI